MFVFVFAGCVSAGRASSLRRRLSRARAGERSLHRAPAGPAAAGARSGRQLRRRGAPSGEAACLVAVGVPELCLELRGGCCSMDGSRAFDGLVTDLQLATLAGGSTSIFGYGLAKCQVGQPCDGPAEHQFFAITNSGVNTSCMLMISTVYLHTIR